MKERTDLEMKERQKEERNEQRKNGLVLSRTVTQLCIFIFIFFNYEFSLPNHKHFIL